MLSPAPVLQGLLTHAHLKDLLTRSYTMLDARDAIELQACFTNPAIAQNLLTDLQPAVRTFHFIWNHSSTVNGAAAEAETYVTSHAVYQSGQGHLLRVRGLFVHDQLVRRGRWLIAKRQQTVVWQSEQPTTLAVPVRRSMPLPADFGLQESTAALHWLRDRAAIVAVLQQYSKGIALRDPQVVAGCFDPHVHAEYVGRPPGDGVAYITDIIRGMGSMKYTSQMTGTQPIAIQGDTAQVETYALTGHIADANGALGFNSNGVRYMDTLRKRAGRWLIVHRLHTHDFALKNLPVTLG